MNESVNESVNDPHVDCSGLVCCTLSSAVGGDSLRDGYISRCATMRSCPSVGCTRSARNGRAGRRGLRIGLYLLKTENLQYQNFEMTKHPTIITCYTGNVKWCQIVIFESELRNVP